MKKFFKILAKLMSVPFKLVLGLYSEETLAEAEKNSADYIVSITQETSEFL